MVQKSCPRTAPVRAEAACIAETPGAVDTATRRAAGETPPCLADPVADSFGRSVQQFIDKAGHGVDAGIA